MKSDHSHGLILEPPRPEDFSFGSANSLDIKFAGRTVLQPDSDWRGWVPSGETQAMPTYDPQACTSYGTSNALEILLSQQYGRADNFSDRWIAKGSNTNPASGNTPRNVAEYIRKQWAAYQQEWPDDVPTLQEFYADLPQNLQTLSVGRGAEWDFGWEYIGLNKNDMREALKYSPLGISVSAWTEGDHGYYRPDGMTDNHWVAAVHITDAGEITIFDSYAPYLKTMAADFLPQVAIGYHLTRQIDSEKSWGEYLQYLVLAAYNLLSYFKPQQVAPVVVPSVPQPVPAPIKETTAQKIVAQAEHWLGQDPTPGDEVADEVSCVYSLLKVIRPVIELPQVVSTARLDDILSRDARFKLTKTPSPGCIIVTRTVGEMHGHTGCFLTGTRIASNNSKNGLWEDNYSFSNWLASFQKKGLKVTNIYEAL